MNLNNIIDRVSKYDASLAKELSRYLNSRKYGLVYEESKPEFVRLPNKEVVRGDLVNILPPRGVLETKSKKYKNKWRVASVNKDNNEAVLLSLGKDQKKITANYDNLVAIARFDQPIYTGLKEVDRIERGGDKPFNTIINGENFHALETLMYAYLGKIDCIYIDPPYNSGAKDWKYNNNYVKADDSYRHSKWLTFMQDRLKLAKKLLNPRDSVLICTIDEKEYSRLALLLEQLFPSANIQMVSTVISNNGNARAKQFSRNNEYIFFVMLGESGPQKLALNNQWLGNLRVSSSKTTEGFQWGRMLRGGNSGRRDYSPGCFYPVFFDKDGKYQGIGDVLPLGKDRSSVTPPDGCIAVWPIHLDGSEGCWSCQPKVFQELYKKGYIKFGNKITDRGVRITYIQKGMQKRIENGEIKILGREPKNGTVILDTQHIDAKYIPTTQWAISSHDSTYFGSKLLNKIIGKQKFTFPKSLYAVHDTIKFFVGNKPNATILDFFAGSGTTMHATNLLNYEDGGSRRCICVTNNEVSFNETKKLTQKKLRPGDAEWEANGIAHSVAWPRIKNTIMGVDYKGDPLKGTYGVQDIIYRKYDKSLVNKNTNKNVRTTLYSKIKEPMYPELENLKQADGFQENAIFFDLDYLEPSVIRSDLAFNQIAPLLWLKAGSKGRIIQHKTDYDITNAYAVLFDYKYIGAFTHKLRQHPEIKTIFIVTDVNSRYQDLCHEFSDRNVYKLYESYLRSFEIQSLD